MIEQWGSHLTQEGEHARPAEERAAMETRIWQAHINGQPTDQFSMSSGAQLPVEITARMYACTWKWPN
jgi:hypothetical protein